MSRRADRRCHRPWCALIVAGLLALLLTPGAAQAAGAHMTIHPTLTYGDTVGIVVMVGARSHETCGARVSEGGREEEAPTVETGAKGGAKWSWLVPGNVDAGKWRFAVTCARGGHLEHRSRVFPAGAGFGRSSKGLWIERSMYGEAFRLAGSAGGNGGGGTLYPIGQCTWWVARRRPDLPYFPARSGDAMNWSESAAGAGFPTGGTPVPGAVAVFAPGQYGAGLYGHVAYVTKVNGEEMTISEDNFATEKHSDERTIKWTGLRFIYKKGESLNGEDEAKKGPQIHETEKLPIVSAPELPPPPVKPNVELRGLIENAPVAGDVTLGAVSNAAGVRFSAYYFTELASPESAESVLIGEDRTPADGFTVSWDTTSIPNQGGPEGSTVIVTATALEADGEPEEASSSVRVNVANSRTEGGTTYWPYYVVGLRENHEHELHLRSGPGYSEFAETGERFDGEEVDVVCQEIGEPYVSPRDEETEVWDRLTDGSWAIDYYIDTPNRGRFSPPLKRCG